MRRVFQEGEQNEVYYGDVRMPHYHGVEGSVVELDGEWSVAGLLDDGRVYEIVVNVDFAFDGCSVPRLLWRLTGHPLEVPRIAAALAHDWLYAAQVVDRATADAIYRDILREVGYSAFKASVEYWALRTAGWSAWNAKTDDDKSFARAHGALWIEGTKMTGEEK